MSLLLAVSLMAGILPAGTLAQNHSFDENGYIASEGGALSYGEDVSVVGMSDIFFDMQTYLATRTIGDNLVGGPTTDTITGSHPLTDANPVTQILVQAGAGSRFLNVTRASNATRGPVFNIGGFRAGDVVAATGRAPGGNMRFQFHGGTSTQSSNFAVTDGTFNMEWTISATSNQDGNLDLGMRVVNADASVTNFQVDSFTVTRAGGGNNNGGSCLIYDLASDNTLTALATAGADGHVIFRAPLGGVLSGVNNTSVSLTGRGGNTHGIDISTPKLLGLLQAGRDVRFIISGTVGTTAQSSGSAWRFVRPSGGGGDTVNHAQGSTAAGGAFETDFVIPFSTVSTESAAGSLTYRLGTNATNTNNENIILTTLRILQNDCAGCDYVNCTKGGDGGDDFVEKILFCIQEYPELLYREIDGNISLEETDNFVSGHNTGATAVAMVGGRLEITLTGRGGVGQSLRLNAGTIAPLTVPDHRYRFEYTARSSTATTARIRVEGPATLYNGGAAAANTPFTHSHTFTAAEIIALGDATVSLSVAAGDSVLTYFDIKLVQICPPDCTANCGVDICTCSACDECGKLPCECPCPDCGLVECICGACPDCGKLSCECPCPDCNQFPCHCGACADCGKLACECSLGAHPTFEGCIVYDLKKDNTLAKLSNINVGEHIIFRAPAGGVLSGVANTSVSLTGRTGNTQGIDISTVKLLPLLDPTLDVNFSIAGTVGTAPSSSTSSWRFVRPSGGSGDHNATINHIQGATVAGGAFDMDLVLPYATVALEAVEGSLIYRLGTNTDSTNGQNIILTTLRISQECAGCAGCCLGDACTVCAYENCTGTPPPPPLPFSWGRAGGPALHSANNNSTHRGDEVTLITHGTRTNDDAAILRFSGVVTNNAERDVLREADSMLFMLTPGHTGNRRIWAWTDLSGDLPDDAEGEARIVTGDPNNISTADAAREFLNTENVNAGAIVFAPADTTLEIIIPIELLYRPASGGQPERFAQHIYLLGSLGTTMDNAFASSAQFRRDHLPVSYALLKPPSFPSNISLNIGVNQSEMRFTWWTPKGKANGTVLEYVRADQLVHGAMPATRTRVNGTRTAIPSNLPEYNFDTNRAAATGLQPNTRYAYRVGDGADDRWSDVHFFETRNPASGKQTVLLTGDPQMSQGTNESARWQAGLDRAVDRVERTRDNGLDMILVAGDIAGNGANSVAQYNMYLKNTHLRNLPVFATIGNHDTSSQQNGSASPMGLLSLIYNWPNHDWLGGSPTTSDNNRRGGGNHYFVYGNVLYISLNSNTGGGSSAIAEHSTFLERAVAAHPNTTWRIVQFHHDIFGNGNGHAMGMMGSGRQNLSAVLNANKIDLVINGHEHTHSRSHFMNGLEPVFDQRPADLERNKQDRLIYDPNPGVYVSPEGIPFVTLASISDFPKYSSIFPLLPWTAWTDPTEHDTFSQYSIMDIDGDSLTIETWVKEYTSGSSGTPTETPEYMSNSFTIRKTARYEDLDLLRTGAGTFVQNEITPASWAEFVTARNSAGTIAASATGAQIHAAYMNLYDKYYALVNGASFAVLNPLVKEVEAVLSVAAEGNWMGQYPMGSIEPFTAIFEAAAAVNYARLSTQAQIDEQVAILGPAYEIFRSSVSTRPRPWIEVHNIPAEGVHTISLLHWMDDSRQFQQRGSRWMTDSEITPRFAAHFTKKNFANFSLGETSYTVYVPVKNEIVRTDQPFGPANQPGGRIGSDRAGNGAENPSGHVFRTHAGEWIRYELNVRQAGEYAVRLGAMNANANAMRVALRDEDLNTLAMFTIPANHGIAGWETSPMVSASNNIYLPRGIFVLEMLFLNDGSGAFTSPSVSGNPRNYPDGPSVDIMSFERVGDGTPQVFFVPQGRFMLPLPPNTSAGTPRRQRGWATDGAYSEYGTTTGSPLTLNEISAATHLVLEVAGSPPPPSSSSGEWSNFLILTGGGSDWSDSAVHYNSYNPETGLIRIDLSRNSHYSKWRNIDGETGDDGPRRIIIQYTSDSWDELNVIRAWLELDDSYVPVANCECRRIPCMCCMVCGKPNRFGNNCTCSGGRVISGGGTSGGGGGGGFVSGSVGLPVTQIPRTNTGPGGTTTPSVAVETADGITVSNLSGSTGANNSIQDLRVVVTKTKGGFGTPGDQTNILYTVNVGLFSGTSAIQSLPEPITVSVSLSEFNLAGVNVHRIVAMNGNVIAGGKVVGNSFVFETDEAGNFTIEYVEWLKRLVLTIGALTITDLAGNAAAQNMSVAPVIVEGRTLLPVRYISNALGATVGWDEATREVSLSAGSKNLSFKLGEVTPAMVALGLEVPPMVIDGRTMVPLRFVCEFFGAKVDWNAATRTIEVIID